METMDALSLSVALFVFGCALAVLRCHPDKVQALWLSVMLFVSSALNLFLGLT